MRRQSVIEGFAPTSKALGSWLLASAGIFVIGQLWKTSWHLDAFSSFLAGGIVSAAFTSWSASGLERRRREAIDAFWSPFSAAVTIVLPHLDPTRTSYDATERSAFTPYHDAIACYEVQRFLLDTYGTKATVISCKQAGDLQALLESGNVIAIGGPNLNDTTRMIMDELWSRIGCEIFQWSVTIAGEQIYSHLVKRDGDHFLKIDNAIPSSPCVSDEVFDVLEPSSSALLQARGMALRTHGILREDSTVIVLAGVDTAFGTLAAARYSINPDSLMNIVIGRIRQVMVSAYVHGYNIGSPVPLRVVDSDLLVHSYNAAGASHG